MDRIGHQLGGYRLIKLLGRGGFAEVYLGEHILLNTKAAIKLLRTTLAENDVEDFLKEAKMVANLQHPHIIRILDFSISEQIPFLVMDYLPHGNLRHAHPRGQKVPLATILSYVSGVASALQYAHNQKIIHRDVKPENMLLDQYNAIVLSDFGIALATQTSSQQSLQNVIGTAVYMAPEQFKGKPRRASDQYALAVIVYEWLCGDPPFRGSFTELASQHLFVPPPPLHTKTPDIPAEIEQVVMKALEKDPQKRFPSVENFAQALHQASTRAVTLTPKKMPLPQVLSHQGYKTSYLHTTPMASSSPEQQIPLSNVPSLASNLPLPETLHGFHISRRAVVIGLTTLATAGVTLAGLEFFHLSSQSQARNPLSQGHQTTPLSQSTPLPTNPHSTTPPAQNPTSTYTTVYIGSTDGNLYALDMNSQEKWHFHANNWMNSRPLLLDGIIYAGSNDHNLYALSAKDGSLVWNYQTGDQVVSWPATDGKRIYVGSWDHNVYALQARDGSPIWHYQTQGQVTSAPLVDNGVVYIGSADTYMYALNANTGNRIWSFQANSIIAALASINQSTLYFGSGDNTIYALRAQDGTKLWSYPSQGQVYSTPEIANGIVYCGSNDHKLYALRAIDGSYLWSYQTGAEVASLPIVVDGIVYFASTDKYIYALNANTGTLIWRYQTNGVISSKPVIANGVLYSGGSDGLYAINIKDGSLHWFFNAGYGASTTPTLG